MPNDRMSAPPAYSYDNLSRLLSVLHNNGSLPGSTSYTYDDAGNRTSKTAVQQADPNPVSVTSNYGYDDIFQLTQAVVNNSTTEAYSYDAVGNRLTSVDPASYSYNASNELTSTSSATYTYDANGNTLSKTDTNGTTTYTWDYENRLTSVTLPGTGGTVGFTYDPFGRRIREVFGSATTVYAYDGDNITEELDGSGSVVAHFTQGAGIDEPLAIASAGGTYYYHADGLGSITSLTDGSGQLAASYVYDSFGKLTTSTGTVANPFQFTGREFDSETGLYYYRARYYDPSVGRFLSEDPCRSEVGVSAFGYVDSNPVNYLDWDGCRRKRKKHEPPTNPTPQQMKMLKDGMDTALNALNGKDCKALFCGHGADPAKVLQSTIYQFYALSKESSGAETLPGYLVYINTKGVFVTADSGIVTFGSTRYDLQNSSNVRAMVLLHELGHELGMFGADAGDNLLDENNAHSIDVIKHCFPLYILPVH